MPKLELISATARDMASFRGHVLSTFRKLSGHSAVAKCMRCEKEVLVNSRPAPNEIDVSGEAMAINCPAPKSNCFV